MGPRRIKGACTAGASKVKNCLVKQRLATQLMADSTTVAAADSTGRNPQIPLSLPPEVWTDDEMDQLLDIWKALLESQVVVKRKRSDIVYKIMRKLKKMRRLNKMSVENVNKVSVRAQMENLKSDYQKYVELKEKGLPHPKALHWEKMEGILKNIQEVKQAEVSDSPSKDSVSSDKTNEESELKQESEQIVKTEGDQDQARRNRKYRRRLDLRKLISKQYELMSGLDEDRRLNKIEMSNFNENLSYVVELLKTTNLYQQEIVDQLKALRR